MKASVTGYFEQSIKRLIMASFVLVLLLPIAFFVYSLFQNSWNQVEQRMVEKHYLISEALIKPFSLFFSNRQEAMHALGQELLSLDAASESVHAVSRLHIEDKEKKVQHILDNHINFFGNFLALSYARSPEGEVERIAWAGNKYDGLMPDYSGLRLTALPVLDEHTGERDFFSPMFKSVLSDKPVFLMKHHILDKHKHNKGVIYAEVSLDQIGAMCSQIKFGVKGHCAVIDNAGQLVSHPNKKWVHSIKDVSKISIVQKVLAGKSGIAEFYSPVLKAQMVGGFSMVPELGWGIMIIQPKAELTKILDEARFHTTAWLSIGVIVALFIAVLLTRKIVKPISLLTQLTHKPEKNYKAINLGSAPADIPVEIKQLWCSFANLLSGLQRSHQEVQRLNASLQKDIQLATAELREKNRQLYEASNQDYLTSLSNRRHFTDYLNNVLRNEIGKNIGIIMIDIDKFKHLNDHYGHEAGDLALQHLSSILQYSTRPCDLVARLGGDEFIIYLHDPSESMLAECAERIRSNAEQDKLMMGNKVLPLTVSIGTVFQRNTGGVSVRGLLRIADRAMYESKFAGRNQISTHGTKPTFVV